MRILVCLIAAVLFQTGTKNCAVAQTLLYNPPNGVTITDGRVLVGPDPNIEEHLFGMLTDSDVRREVGFSDAQSNGYKEAMSRLAVSTPQNLFKDAAARAAFKSGRSAAILDALREVVTPEQQSKLKALAYRYEVSAVGLPEALTAGRLSDEVGVYPNQHERILRIGAEIEARLRDDIHRLRKEAELQLLQELSPEQREKAKTVLGDYFLHQEVRSVANLYQEKRSVVQASMEQEGKSRKQTARDK